MGLRHATGIAGMAELSGITLVDKFDKALEAAKEQIQGTVNGKKFTFFNSKDFSGDKEPYDVAILASTAQDRLRDLELLRERGVKHFLIEKPLGQSYEEVINLADYFKRHSLDASVNLNMRLYDCFIELKRDLAHLPQLKGAKTITVNTGTIGIGGNGIHYLDLLYFLLGADEARLIAGEIDDELIFSPRGEQFNDFGGWCKINFFSGNSLLGKAILSISSQSSVFGGWEIIAPYGRIRIDELAQKRINTYRKPDSQLSLHRYAADYMPADEINISSPFLGDLTKKWLENLLVGKNILPSLNSSLPVHRLMFDWLEKNPQYNGKFPIT